MAYQLWSQDNFSKGELSPFMYARVSVQQYYSGMKTAQNVLTFPTGAAGKRFGTLYQATLTGFTTAQEIFFETFQYANEAVYQLLFKPDKIDIFLEGILVKTVTSTGLNATDVFNLDSTVLGTHFRITGQSFAPKDLVRTANAGNVISSVSGGVWNMTTAITAGLILPLQVTTSGALPTTIPQIVAGVTYFGLHLTTSTIALYPTSQDAKNRTNAFTLVDNGSGTNTVIEFNTWNLVTVTFKNLPIYDFDDGYDGITFTPAAVSGASIDLNASSPIFTAAMAGGAFIGGGGVARIIQFSSNVVVQMAILVPFDSTVPLRGTNVLLAEPAWSNARG